MANFDIALTFTLAEEGGYKRDPDTGEMTNFGITSSFLHSIRRPYAEANLRMLTIDDATQLFRQYYWDTANLDDITDQALANTVFDLRACSNGMGMVPAIWCLQQAINTLQASEATAEPDTAVVPPVLPVSGQCDAAVIAIVNSLDPAKLLIQLTLQAMARYLRLAKGKRAKNLSGWLDRLERSTVHGPE